MRIQFIMILVVILFLFTSCISLQRKEPIQHEKGFIIAMQYTGPVDADGVSVGVTSTASGPAMTVSPVHVHQDEQYMVVFRCQHGVVFSINRKGLFNKLDEKDSVIIDYYELVDSKGVVRDLDFVDANKMRK